ncbi:obscurin-like [Garra rufa]|uniref:obscurin-like n=1 Tax=Garra rufa TaxID=137080 RepID=UPI003CCEEA9A
MADKCHLCLLGLIILSSLLTGTSGEDYAHKFISSGENVYLPCNNALPDCKSTTWIYENRFRHIAAVELIYSGIKKKDTERHERLSLGCDCSLNIKNITKEDYGSYTCQQSVNDKQQGTNASVYLHVLHVSSSSSQTEISPGSSVTLSCQLYSYAGEFCEYWIHSEGIEVFWVNQAGVKLTKSDSRYQISAPGDCTINLTTTLLNEHDNREWRCQVTHRNQVKTSVTYTVKISGVRGVDDVHVFISSGENVHLPCNNALPDCSSTTWIYNNRHSAAVELIGDGIKKKDTERHERLSLGSDCSLNIKNITNEDYGLYSCRQWTDVNRDQKHGNDTCVYLHVLHVSSSSSQTEISPGSSVSLSCQMDSYSYTGGSCGDWIHSEGIELFWVNQAGVKLTISDSRYQISAPGHCIITLTTTLLNEDVNRDWKCEVTHRDQVKTSVTYTVKSSAQDKTTTAVIPVHITNSQDRKTEARWQETPELIYLRTPVGVANPLAPLRFRAERLEEDVRLRLSRPVTLAGLSDKPPEGLEEE